MFVSIVMVKREKLVPTPKGRKRVVVVEDGIPQSTLKDRVVEIVHALVALDLSEDQIKLAKSSDQTVDKNILTYRSYLIELRLLQKKLMNDAPMNFLKGEPLSAVINNVLSDGA